MDRAQALCLALRLVLTLAAVTSHGALIAIYVSPGGGGDGSRARPTDLQSAPNLSRTAGSGTVIRLQQGSYLTGTQAFTLTGATGVVGGWFFGAKPKVCLEDPTTGKRKSCKAVTVGMDPATGASWLTLVVPVLPELEHDNYRLIIVSPVGSCSQEFPISTGEL